MNCHECAMGGIQTPAVAICRFCMVGLCKRHLVESFRDTPPVQYACRHQPGSPARVGASAQDGASVRALATGGGRN